MRMFFLRLFATSACILCSVAAFAQYQEEVEPEPSAVTPTATDKSPKSSEAVSTKKLPVDDSQAPPTEGGDKKAEDAEIEEAPEKEANAAKLMCLNKVTARTSEIIAQVGLIANFGNLEIVVRACKKSPPDKKPENSALVEIWELKTGKKPEQIFNGWMLSSSPAVSGLENPVYDVTVAECLYQELEH